MKRTVESLNKSEKVHTALLANIKRSGSSSMGQVLSIKYSYFFDHGSLVCECHR